MALDINDRAKAGSLAKDPANESTPVPVDGELRKASLRLVTGDGDEALPLPSDVHAEATLLGALLWSATYDNGRLHAGVVRDIIEPPAFFSAAHRAIFEVVAHRTEEHAPVDTVSVHSELLKRGSARTAGGIEYLELLVSGATPTSDVQLRGYAQSVRDTWTRRRAIDVAEQIIKAAKNGRMSAFDLIEKARANIDDLASSASVGAQITLASDVVERIVHREASPKKVGRKLRTGILGIDSFMNGGLPDNEVTLVGARTSIGKSAFSAQIAKRISTNDPEAAGLYISLEMSDESLVDRWACAEARIDSNAVENATLTPVEQGRYIVAKDTIHRLPIAFSAHRSQSIRDILNAIERAQHLFHGRNKRLRYVVIDHLHIVKVEKGDDVKSDSGRREFMRKVSKMLPYIVERYQIGVIGLVQVSRAAEAQGKETTPRLHHIKDSSSLEDDADNVIFIHRPRKASGGFVDDTAKIIVAKQRHRARLGSFEMQVDSKFSLFEDASPLRMEAASRTFVDGYGQGFTNGGDQ